MPVSAAEREVLFGTSVITYQMQIYLLKRPGYRANGKEFRTVFSDLSKAAFTSAVISLETRGIIAPDGEDVIIFPDKASIRGIILDRCWKAMHIEKRFTVSSICDLTGYTPEQVREAIRRFLIQGAVRTVLKVPFKPAVYEVVKDAAIRPVSRKRRHTGSLVENAWCFVRKASSFSFQDLVEKCGMSSRYAKDLVMMFKKAGVISEEGLAADGHTKVYRVKENAPVEAPVVKNSSRIKRVGY